MKRREFLHVLTLGVGTSLLVMQRRGGGVHQMGKQSFVVDTTKSPHAKLRPIPIGVVKLHDQFWQPRLVALQEVTLPTQYELIEKTGRLDNFRRVFGKVKGDFRGLYFNDS
ncbi:MAG: hypothetical protein GDYSWBUE_000339, partial [Candidatus Fervidibacterota bacterium]